MVVRSNVVIHNTAIVSESAKIEAGVNIGPYCIIGENVSIGKNTSLHAHVVVDGITEIGDNCEIYPFASIGSAPQAYEKASPYAKTIIGNNNIIRESVTISSGSTKAELVTTIGNSCLFMTGAHIGHDCIVGDNVILANHSSLGGHVTLDNNVIIGGGASVHQYSRIGRLAMVSGFNAINRDLMPFTMMIMFNGMNSMVYRGIAGVNVTGLKRAGFEKADISALVSFYANFLTHIDNMHEKNMTLAEKYDKYQHLLFNKEHKECIKNFMSTKSHQGIHRDMVRSRHITSP